MSGLAQVERDHILRALAASNWVIGGRNGAAERLRMKRTSSVYRMKKLRIADQTVSHVQLPSRVPQAMPDLLISRLLNQVSPRRVICEGPGARPA